MALQAEYAAAQERLAEAAVDEPSLAKIVLRHVGNTVGPHCAGLYPMGLVLTNVAKANAKLAATFMTPPLPPSMNFVAIIG